MKKIKFLPEQNIASINYKLRKFSIRRFSLVEPAFDITSNFDPQKLNINFNIDFENISEQCSFGIIFDIGYFYELNNNNIKLLDISLITDFFISDMNKIIEIEGENFNIPTDLLINFVSIVYSTTRGILFAKTQGSFLNQFLLPLIDPKLIVEQKLKTLQISIDESKK
jgi:hypothetical protein